QGGPGYQGPPLIQIDGSDAVSDGLGASGILIAASDVTVQGLVISNFHQTDIGDGWGIQVSGSEIPISNINITGNYIGTNLTGTLAQPNEAGGILIFGLVGA